MERCKNFTTVLMCALLLLVSFILSVDQSWAQLQGGNAVVKPSANQLNDAMNAAAKQHKIEKVGRTTTNDDRAAAARRNAARKSTIPLKANGGVIQ